MSADDSKAPAASNSLESRISMPTKADWADDTEGTVADKANGQCGKWALKKQHQLIVSE